MIQCTIVSGEHRLSLGAQAKYPALSYADLWVLAVLGGLL